MYTLERIPIAKSMPKGDPDDLSLRKIERNVLIPELMREVASKNQCKDVTKDFFDCAKDNGILIAPKCIDKRDKLTDCMTYWLNNKEFKEEITAKYLKDRSEYRKTGISNRPSKRMHSGTHN
ncbi:COX assembly mitochondrial protein homolog [Tetranychus urticae]|uniref:COX assembly mitochondrial protein n=1 Tax=Tetranychus urticae TaxID=32264 RepID=T1L3T0_TETUR|nr:COX assembly mitochondrial protein homolog [Tetranychus urticae]